MIIYLCVSQNFTIFICGRMPILPCIYWFYAVYGVMIVFSVYAEFYHCTWSHVLANSSIIYFLYINEYLLYWPYIIHICPYIVRIVLNPHTIKNLLLSRPWSAVQIPDKILVSSQKFWYDVLPPCFLTIWKMSKNNKTWLFYTSHKNVKVSFNQQ